MTELESAREILTTRADLDPLPYGDACILVTEKKFRRLAHSAGWTINEIESGVDTLPRVDGKILLTANQPERKTKPHRGTMAQFAQQYGILLT